MVGEDLVEEVVARVISRLRGMSASSFCYGDVDRAVEEAWKAQRAWQWDFPLERRKKILSELRAFLRGYAEELARMAAEETGMGNVSDKIAKNQLAIDKTPGPDYLETRAISGDSGLTLEELAPFGVIASLTPSTNPTATVINNAICMLSSGNAVVFAPHPSAVRCSLRAVELISTFLSSVGVPPALVSVLSNVSLENANRLMQHPKVKMVVATGGPGVVRAALSSGKPAIGAGPGNPPVVVDETAHLEKAASDIATGASFDNNLPCIAEKELIAVHCIADQLKRHMMDVGVLELKGKDAEALKKLVLDENGKPRKGWMGKSAPSILEAVGVRVSRDIRLILVETTEEDPLVQEEMLMPILPMVRVPDFDSALAMALRVEHSFKHSAVIHSTNVDHMSEMARAMDTTIFVKNAPSLAAIGYGSDCPTSFTIATTTGEGPTTPLSFCRTRRCVLWGAFRIV